MLDLRRATERDVADFYGSKINSGFMYNAIWWRGRDFTNQDLSSSLKRSNLASVHMLRNIIQHYKIYPANIEIAGVT
jgi:hypothetical protein